ncbi:MAG: hypothetical protein HAW63_01815 [Bdellovibrionaceae bacterium]|nr:hypothetical protein [Pseudobdellovibrionaceae bacterium]
MPKLLLLFAFLFYSSVLFAKKPSKNDTIRFSEETIEGEFNTTDLFYLLKEDSLDNRYLFKLRNHFKPEMKATGLNLEKSFGGFN